MTTKGVVTSTTEQRILDTATRLEAIANRLDNIFKICGSTVGQIERAGMTARVAELEKEGTALYDSIIPDASALYDSWPGPKQTRAQRTLRLEMAKAGEWNFNQGGVCNLLEDLKRGNAKHLFDLPMHAGEIKTAAYLLRGVVSENRNPDTTDAYLERIKNAVLIEPRPGYWIATSFSIADGEGKFTGYEWERIRIANQKTEIPKVVSELVGREKVIFFPIRTLSESASFNTARNKSIELPSEIEVRDHVNGRPTGKVVGKLVAEEFSPFTEKDAEHVIQFLKDNVLKMLRTVETKP